MFSITKCDKIMCFVSAVNEIKDVLAMNHKSCIVALLHVYNSHYGWVMQESMEGLNIEFTVGMMTCYIFYCVQSDFLINICEYFYLKLGRPDSSVSRAFGF